MQLDNVTLQRIISASVECGVANFCERNGIKTKDEISQREAFRLYGEFKVRKWEQLKKITPKIIGNGINSKKRYSRSQIELQITIEGMMP